MLIEPETPEERAAWKRFMASPEFDRLLNEAAKNTEPKIDMSAPGVLEKFRKELMAKREVK